MGPESNFAELPVAYRDTRNLYGGDPPPEEPRSKRYVLWLLPLLVLGANIGRIAKALGFKASSDALLVGTIVMGLVFIVGAIIAYGSARAAAARDLEELIHPRRR